MDYKRDSDKVKIATQSMTDTFGRMHSDAQFAGFSIPAHEAHRTLKYASLGISDDV